MLWPSPNPELPERADSVTPKLNSAIHRSTAAVTVPAEASGDQPIETGPGVTTGPHTPDGGHAIGSKEPL